MKKSRITKAHSIPFFIPNFYGFPKPFTKTEIDSQDISHNQIVNCRALNVRQFRRKTYRPANIRLRLKYAQRQRDDRM